MRTKIALLMALSVLGLSAARLGPAEGNSPAAAPDQGFSSEKPLPGYFPLAPRGAAADIYVDTDDWKVARIAAGDLAQDVERVTGRRPSVKNDPEGLSARAVLVGTIGRSRLIDRLIKDGRLDAADVRGRWECFVMSVVPHPWPGLEQVLVIAGSDRRGTAYGAYELSREIGVSPWYWWADVTPNRRAEIHIRPDRRRVGPPAVRYRGIFINDEMWGLRPWAAGNHAPEEGQGLGPKTYARIFELLLRLRANYLWPAMHIGTIPFNIYPGNAPLADDYAVVMGSSHIEPLLRNNIEGAEWDREGGRDWNYRTNREAILEYWTRRLKANGRFENIYTLGMRGKDDEPMYATGTMPEKIGLLEQIFSDQRRLLAQNVDPQITQVPQVFIPYTEVLGLYDGGLKVPEDVIICWPDNNFGYIRRLPTAAEQARPGGSGIYFHIQWLNGATTAYTWLNTTPPALIWEEMNKAWRYGAKSLWVLNVGDIKPGEIGTEFFLDMAWDPERCGPDSMREFLVRWAARDLDPRFAEPVAALMEEYYRLGFTRRPEHLLQWAKEAWRYSWFSPDAYGDEAGQRLDRYADIARRAEAIYAQIPRERKDAFFELVYYPIQAANLMNRKIIFADRSMRAADQGRAGAGESARQARSAAEEIVALTAHYNKGLITAGGKWNYMMSWDPGPWGDQRHQFEMPPLSDYDGTGAPALGLGLEGGQEDVLADLSVYTRGKRFIDLYNKGRGPIHWQVGSLPPWLKLSVASGSFTLEQRIWIEADWDRVPAGAETKAPIEIRSSGGDRKISVPVFNPAAPRPGDFEGFVESHGYVSMEAEHFTRRQDRSGAAWQIVRGLGRSGDSVTVLPPTLDSLLEPAAIRSGSPALEFDMWVFHPGEARLDIDCLPTEPVAPGRGARLAVALDGQAPQVVTGPRGDVLTNLRRLTTNLKIVSDGKHTLTVWMVDPGVVVDKIVLYTSPARESYLGPPESYRR